MARQWRIEYAGALYHVMSRSNGGQDIFRGDIDRNTSIELLAELANRFSIKTYAFLLATNHYRLLLKTKQASLSKAMQWFGMNLNSIMKV